MITGRSGHYLKHDMAPSNELRVFISSTFRDMEEEREHLVKKLFPEIRSLCRESGIAFIHLYLRQELDSWTNHSDLP